MRKVVKYFIRGIFVIGLVVLTTLAVYVISWAVQLQNAERYVPEKTLLKLRIPSLGKLATEWLNLEAADIVFAYQNLGELRALVRDLRSAELATNPLLRHIAEVPFDFALTRQGFLLGFDLGWRSLLIQPINWLGGFVPIENLSAVQSGGALYFRFSAGDSHFFLALRTNIVLISDSEKLLMDVLKAGNQTPSSSTARSRASTMFRQSSSGLRLLADTPALIQLVTQQNPDVSRILKNFDLPEESLLTFDLTNQNLKVHLATALQGTVPQARAVIEYPIENSGQFSRVPGTATTWSLVNVAGLQELVDLLLVQEPSLAQDFQRAREATNLLLGISLEDLLFKWTTGELGLFLLPGSDDPVILVKVKNQTDFERAMSALEGSLFLSQSSRFLVDQIPLNQLRLPPVFEILLRLFKVELELPYYTVHEGYFYLSQDSGNIVRSINAILEGNTLEKNPGLADLVQETDRKSRLLLYYNIRHGIPFFMRDQSLLSRVLRLYQKGIASITLQDRNLDITIRSHRDRDNATVLLPGFPRPLQGQLSSRLHVLSPDGARRFFAYVADENRIVLDGILEESVRTLPLPQAKYFLPLTTNRTTSRLYGFQRNAQVSAWTLDGGAIDGFPVALEEGPQTEPVMLGNDVLIVTERSHRAVLLSSRGNVASWAVQFEDPVSYPPAVRDGRVAIYPRRFDGDIYLFDSQGKEMPGSPLATEGLGVASPVWVRYQGQNHLYFLTTEGRIFAWGPGAESRGQIAWFSGAYQAPPLVLKGRGNDEVLAILSREGILTLVSAEGGLIRESRLEVSGEAKLAQGDLDGDGLNEIVVYGFGNRIWVLDQNLRHLAPQGLQGYSEPAYFDLNGDRRLDLITVGLDQQIYAWAFPRP